MAINRTAQFEILMAALAIVEEERAIPLGAAAARLGVTRDELQAILDPVLFLAFDPPDGVNPIDRTQYLYLTDDDVVTLDIDGLTDGVWLRNLVTRPPSHDTALDWYLSSIIMQSLDPSPALEAAIAKLADIVRVTLVVPLEQPPALGVVQQAWSQQLSVFTRYLAEGSEAAQEREIVPWRIYANWGRWYVKGTATDHGEERTYRIDRMLDARLGSERYDRPHDVVIPSWFDMEHNVRTVRVRMPVAIERSLATPIVFTDRTLLPGDREEVSITVNGDGRFDHLLVSLPPEAEVLDAAATERRREYAARLLTDYA